MQSGQGAHILTGRFQNLNHTPILYIVDIDMHGVHINIIYIMRSYLWVTLIQPRRMIANTLNQEVDKHPDLGR